MKSAFFAFLFPACTISLQDTATALEPLHRPYSVEKDVSDVAEQLEKIPAWKHCQPPATIENSKAELVDELVAFLNETNIRGMGDDNLPTEYLRGLALGAIAKRFAFKWTAESPWDVYRGYTVAEYLFDEPREVFRDSLFIDAIRLMHKHNFFRRHPCAKAETVARFLHGHMMKEAFGRELKFIPDSTPAFMSPRDIIRHGGASCTGHSILVVSMLRAVGIPSRVAGVPLWNTKDGGNHSWIEVYVNGEWKWADGFISSPKDDAWNQAWFFPDYIKKQIPDDKTKSVYATTYWPTERFPALKEESEHLAEDFPLEWNTKFDGVKGLKRTKWYQAQIKQESDDLLTATS